MLSKLSTLVILFSLSSAMAFAHCDSIDGPVIHDAKKALSTKKIDSVLKWVTAKDEKEISKAFKNTLEVRNQSKAAQELADQYFFETLVRVHRASEGEGFTGIKPAGQVDQAIAATDRALQDGNITSLANSVADSVRNGTIHRFENTSKLLKNSEKSPKAGREYVKAYVELTHYVSAIHQIATEGASHKHIE